MKKSIVVKFFVAAAGVVPALAQQTAPARLTPVPAALGVPAPLTSLALAPSPIVAAMLAVPSAVTAAVSATPRPESARPQLTILTGRNGGESAARAAQTFDGTSGRNADAGVLASNEQVRLNRYDQGVDQNLAAEIKAAGEIVGRLRSAMEEVIVGQKELIASMIETGIAGEHILLEGLPGGGKTKTATTFAAAILGKFRRVQGNSDNRPSDIIGIQMLVDTPEGKKMVFEEGPVFSDLLLVDEVNRNTPKANGVLLQVMEERQVTVGNQTYKVSPQVIATQNPIEQEGTYPLPEAQLDRFMYKVPVPESSEEELVVIAKRFAGKENQPKISPVSTVDELARMGRLAEKIYVDNSLYTYAARLVRATHEPGRFGIELGAGSLVEKSGASNRAMLFLVKAARIRALTHGRAWVGPDDFAAVAHRVLRHRVSIGYKGLSRGLTPDQFIDKILEKVKIPLPAAPR